MKVPKGTSDYQAAWIAEEADDDAESGDDDEDEDDDDDDMMDADMEGDDEDIASQVGSAQKSGPNNNKVQLTAAFGGGG